MTTGDGMTPGVASAIAARPWHLRLADMVEPHRTWLRITSLTSLLLAGLLLVANAATASDAGAQSLLRQASLGMAIIAALTGLALCGHWLVADIQRFSVRRIMAIASIGFIEAMRRRVWLVAPLAMIVVLVVTQFARPFDEQDAVRLTAKYCLLATGFVVVVVAILLAGTNLPKEIESRVIFTIVTKPTTRLEIVLGKIVGFSIVNAALLLVMGLFTLTYVELQGWVLKGRIQTALAADKVEATDRARLERVAAGGLTVSKAIQWPGDMQIFGRTPNPADNIRWIAGGHTTYFLVPFKLSPEDIAKFNKVADEYVAQIKTRGALGPSPFSLLIRVRVDETAPTRDEREQLESDNLPRAGDFVAGPSVVDRKQTPLMPQFHVGASSLKSSKPIAIGDLFGPQRAAAAVEISKPEFGTVRTFRVSLSPSSIAELLETGRFNIEVSSPTPTLLFGVVPGTPPVTIEGRADTLVEVTHDASLSIDDSTGGIGGRHDPPGIRFYSRLGRNGMQLTGRSVEEGGGPGGLGTVAVYSYRNMGTPAATDGKVTLQTRIGIDRGGDLDADQFRSSAVQLLVRNAKNPSITAVSGEFSPATNRLTDITVDAAPFEGGDYDIIVLGVTPGQYLGVSGLTASVPSVGVVSAQHPFAWNLLKALTVLWMLSVLVVSIAVFSSTFLSWPIAVVLTVLLLLGRWGVNELGDAILPGASRSTVGDIFKIRDVNKGKAISDSMELLNSLLRSAATVLPDLGNFPVVEDINRGVSIAPADVGKAGWELLRYGVPLIGVTYLILRNKEVAP